MKTTAKIVCVCECECACMLLLYDVLFHLKILISMTTNCEYLV